MYRVGYDKCCSQEEMMEIILIFLCLFLGFGLFARHYNTWIRLLLIIGVATMLLLLYLT
jgi:hypothetical protein